jgi:hypothetical protein
MTPPHWLRRLRRALAQWWECRTKRCSYYAHYQVYGPCELTHEGWHHAERKGEEHFRNCDRWEHCEGLCPVCIMWEKRLRA